MFAFIVLFGVLFFMLLRHHAGNLVNREMIGNVLRQQRALRQENREIRAILERNGNYQMSESRVGISRREYHELTVGLKSMQGRVKEMATQHKTEKESPVTPRQLTREIRIPSRLEMSFSRPKYQSTPRLVTPRVRK